MDVPGDRAFHGSRQSSYRFRVAKYRTRIRIGLAGGQEYLHPQPLHDLPHVSRQVQLVLGQERLNGLQPGRHCVLLIEQQLPLGTGGHAVRHLGRDEREKIVVAHGIHLRVEISEDLPSLVLTLTPPAVDIDDDAIDSPAKGQSYQKGQIQSRAEHQSDVDPRQ
jgi:hypothetical protein